MTATDELRRLLDERGVEYREHRYGNESMTTIWRALGTEVHYRESRHGATRMHADSVTPEQAVEATLGRVTCRIKPWKMERDTGFYDCMECECGYVSDVSDWAKWRYCPNCGRRCVG